MQGTQSRVRPILFTVILFVVLLGIGFVAWRMVGGDGGATPEAKKAISEATCDYDDAELCKFMASWKIADSYTVKAEQTTGGEVSTTTMQFADSSRRSHVKGTGGGVTYEIITINKTSYTKAGNTWWKRVLDASANNESLPGEELRADIPSPDSTDFKKIGTEDCGDLSCLKYQIVDAGTTGVIQYIWFDTDDYRLRRLGIDAPGSTTEQTFTYDPVTISEPTPVKELAPNQMIVPGATAPSVVPENLGL